MDLVIDDLRTLPVSAEHMRTSADGLAWLIRHDKVRLNTLWLDHDLGPGDDIMPVVDYLCERSFNNDPHPVDMVLVHSMNPSGADNIVRSLSRYGYKVRKVPVPQ